MWEIFCLSSLVESSVVVLQFTAEYKKHCSRMRNEQEESMKLSKISQMKPRNVFFWLLSRNIPDISEKCHTELMCIAGRWIYKMCAKQYRVEVGRSIIP